MTVYRFLPSPPLTPYVEAFCFSEGEAALQTKERRLPDGRPRPLMQTPSPTLGLRHRRPDRSYRAFTDEELDRFFEVIPTDTVKGLRDRAIFLLYFWTARRREEIARLRWGDIEQGIIVEEGGKR